MEERWKRGGREEKGREERRERARGEKRQEVRRRNLVRDLSKGDTEKGRPNKQHIIFFSFSFTLVFPRFFSKNNKNKLTLKSQQLLARWRQDQSIHPATMWSIWNDKFHPSRTNEAFHFLFVLQSQPTQWLLLFVLFDFRRLTRWCLHVSNNNEKKERRKEKKRRKKRRVGSKKQKHLLSVRLLSLESSKKTKNVYVHKRFFIGHKLSKLFLVISCRGPVSSFFELLLLLLLLNVSSSPSKSGRPSGFTCPMTC